jgi:hypothetical protein
MIYKGKPSTFSLLTTMVLTFLVRIRRTRTRPGTIVPSKVLRANTGRTGLREILHRRVDTNARNARWCAVPLVLGLLPGVARADFSKTITVVPNVEVNAVTTWYYSNCDTSLGVGSYMVNVAPSHGVLNFGAISGPVPGCPTGSPSLPAAAAYYTWMDATGATTDYFQLYFEVNGSVAEVIDISVVLAEPECSITSQTVETVPGIANSRTTIGVGEVVDLSAAVPVTWDISSGSGTLSEECAGLSQTCSFAAPNVNDTSTVTATLPGSSCPITFTTLQPTGLIFQRLQWPSQAPDYYFFGIGPDFAVKMISVAFLTPGNVSFGNVFISEHDDPNPHLDPTYNLLFNINGTNAWLVGCDIDIDNTHEETDPKHSYWVFLNNSKTTETPFSLVQTQWSHDGVFANYEYSKGQIEALSSDGVFVPTPGASAATLTVPWNTFYLNDFTIPTVPGCPVEVQNQFPTVPANAPVGLSIR